MNTDRVVLAYLQHKNYPRAEAALKDEGAVESVEDMAFRSYASVDTNVANYILFHNPSEGPASYAQSYAHLKQWIITSLEVYRVRCEVWESRGSVWGGERVLEKERECGRECVGECLLLLLFCIGRVKDVRIEGRE